MLILASITSKEKALSPLLATGYPVIVLILFHIVPIIVLILFQMATGYPVAICTLVTKWSFRQFVFIFLSFFFPFRSI